MSYCVVCRRTHVLLCCLRLFAYSGVHHFVLLCVFTVLVPSCDVLYDFRVKTMFALSYPHLFV